MDGGEAGVSVPLHANTGIKCIHGTAAVGDMGAGEDEGAAAIWTAPQN